jgi:hypothetical protein
MSTALTTELLNMSQSVRRQTCSPIRFRCDHCAVQQPETVDSLRTQLAEAQLQLHAMVQSLSHAKSKCVCVSCRVPNYCAINSVLQVLAAVVLFHRSTAYIYLRMQRHSREAGCGCSIRRPLAATEIAAGRKTAHTGCSAIITCSDLLCLRRRRCGWIAIDWQYERRAVQEAQTTARAVEADLASVLGCIASLCANHTAPLPARLPLGRYVPAHALTHYQ